MFRALHDGMAGLSDDQHGHYQVISLPLFTSSMLM
jgi:hypothetical protein